MPTLRSRIALLLLACFMRVLVPDAWLLALHTHAHTAHEATPLKASKALVSSKHQHCSVDHFYDVPFQAAPSLAFAPLPAVYASLRSATSQSVWEYAAWPAPPLRGPPTRA